MGKQIGWLLLTAGFIASMFVGYEAITLPFLRGAGLAQADFELFIVCVVLGVPGIAAAVGGSLLLRRRNASTVSAQNSTFDASVLLAVLVGLIVIASLGFSLAIRKFGFFWQ